MSRGMNLFFGVEGGGGPPRGEGGRGTTSAIDKFFFIIRQMVNTLSFENSPKCLDV